MIRPNFFIVGAAKCGTTSMYEYLRVHPEVFMPEKKEPYFFGRDLEIADYWAIRDETQYLSLFTDAGQATRVGEASVWYLPSQQAAQEIKQFDPQAKIIIMLRNPVDMAYSLHGQFLFSSNEDIVDFQEAWDAQSDRQRGQRIPPTSHFPRGLQYTQMATYSPQVQRYLDVFGPQAVHVIIFDDLISDTQTVYQRVIDFLEIDPDFRPDFSVANAAKPLRNLPAKRFLKSYPRVEKALGATLSPSIRHCVGNTLTKILKQPSRGKKLSPDLRRELMSQFRPDIDQLSSLIDRDLTGWYQHA